MDLVLTALGAAMLALIAAKLALGRRSRVPSCSADGTRRPLASSASALRDR